MVISLFALRGVSTELGQKHGQAIAFLNASQTQCTTVASLQIRFLQEESV